MNSPAIGGESSLRAPIRSDRPGHAVERAVGELADEEPRRIDRAGRGRAALGNDFEAALDVVGLVAHQDDQPVTLDVSEALGLLRTGTMSIEGRLVDASNTTLYCELSADGVTAGCVYKPIRGERPRGPSGRSS